MTPAPGYAIIYSMETSTKPQHWLFLIAVATSLILVDQLSKAWIVANLGLYESKELIPALADFFTLTYTRNTGAAFGLFQGVSNIFLVIALVATVVIVYYYRKLQGNYWFLRLGMGLMLGGAIGNAIDRVTRGYVVDFLHVFYDPLNFSYPIFNFADAAIVIGVGLLVLLLWGKDDAFADQQPTDDTTDEETNLSANYSSQ